jgi:hypothetical protein
MGAIMERHAPGEAAERRGRVREALLPPRERAPR